VPRRGAPAGKGRTGAHPGRWRGRAGAFRVLDGLQRSPAMASRETATVRVLRGTEVVSSEVPYASLHAGTVMMGVASPEPGTRLSPPSVWPLTASASMKSTPMRTICAGRFGDFMEKWGFQRRE